MSGVSDAGVGAGANSQTIRDMWIRGRAEMTETGDKQYHLIPPPVTNNSASTLRNVST